MPHSLTQTLTQALFAKILLLPVSIARRLAQGFSSLLHSVIRIAPIAWMIGWVVFDALLAYVSLRLVYHYYYQGHMYFGNQQVLAAIFAVHVVLAGGVFGLYDKQLLHANILKLLFCLTSTVLVAIVGVTFIYSIHRQSGISYWSQFYTFATCIAVISPPRILGYLVAKRFKIKILLVGGGRIANIISRRIQQEKAHYELVGFCGDNSRKSRRALGGLEDIPAVCREKGVHEVVISSEYIDDPLLLDRAFEIVQTGCSLIDETAFYERAFEVVLVDQIDRGWFYSAKLGKHSRLQAFLKRLLDILIASISLMLLAPIFAMIWALVRLTSKGPAIYWQVRCGQYNKPFRIYKFRSMAVNAEKNGAQWAKKNDGRVTPIGRLLRKSRLDEIPQFWNIIKGDMSFVGPRPERPEFVEQIEKRVPFFGFRHWARPGLTGLAQIRYRYGASIEDSKEKLQHDLYYIKNWSLLLDLRVILRTFSAIMKGAR